MDLTEEHKLFFPALDLLFEGNKYRNPKKKIPFKEFNNDVINKEREKELEHHYIKWYWYENDLPDTDDEEE